MNKAYLGSTNKAKLKALKEVLYDYEIIGAKVDSLVSPQPLSDDEAIKGALNRAKALPEGSLRFGFEAGVNIHNDLMFLVNWGVLIDEDNNVYFAGGTRIPLDEAMKQMILNDKKELSEVMEIITNQKDVRSLNGAIGYLTNDLVVRSDIFVHIAKLLYGQYLRRKK